MSLRAYEIVGEDQDHFYGQLPSETKPKPYPKDRYSTYFTPDALVDWRKIHPEGGPDIIPTSYKPRKKKQPIKVEPIEDTQLAPTQLAATQLEQEEDEKLLIEQLRDSLKKCETAYTKLELKYQNLEADYMKLSENSDALIQDGTQHRVRLETALREEQQKYFRLEQKLDSIVQEHKLHESENQRTKDLEQQFYELEAEAQGYLLKSRELENQLKAKPKQSSENERLRQEIAALKQQLAQPGVQRKPIILKQVKPHREAQVKAFLAVVSGVY